MRLEDRQWAGLLLLVGTTQFAIGMIIAEAVDPSYSVSTNYISDLGVRAGAAIFNTSIILLGITILATSWFLLRAFKDPILMVLFLFAGLSAILAFRILRPPLSYVSVLLGVGSLAALGLFISNNFLGLGNGGMERMIVYPVLTWGIGFSGYLLGMSHSQGPPAAS